MNKEKLTDIGDRLNALREIYVDTVLTDYEDLDIGVKLIQAAALVELVKIERENQDIKNILESIESHLYEISESQKIISDKS